ncbi:flagellar basal-body MS-ring/collar protein FliF [Pontivivens insulae]|uniref:Flagellar M-ring protein n=1 Tax=Pontivivens insulae TaxID=1639689 RepID=A0A2R8A9W3_9RHOB|nr:flagellar basal-body MS-ring/collar protein FliF [Pontivivens insulae]RED12943.1 flagellar M-ring protein FliF [Pontivivens insulae]SPF29036.1 Flagellar M-ring protein [Pontivivens insulae]
MQSLINSFASLNRNRQIASGLAAVAIFALILTMLRVASSPQMELLYAGLDPMAASGVVTALEVEGVPLEVRGSAIYVPASARDRVRMNLAGQGLPASGNAGYELLDSLSGFGTTSQMFNAAYARAQEGELARTIASSPDVRAARVHISQLAEGPFDRAATSSASVTLTMASGRVTGSYADAVRHLIASAIAGVEPENVAVIDAEAGQLVARDAEVDTFMVDHRASAMRQNVERLLEARVGQGRAIVEVSLEAITEAETITERVIDPDSRVAISSDIEEDLENSAGGAAGAVTVASNLPDGDAAGQTGENRRELTRTRERTSYDVSEVLRERVRPPGDIRRLTVAVLVDGVRGIGADGNSVWEARSPQELQVLADLVKSAIGFSEERGDVITLQSLQFPEPPDVGTEITSPDYLSTLPVALLAQLGVLGLVAIALGVFVLRPLLTPRNADVNVLETLGPNVLPTPEPAPASLSTEDQQVEQPTDTLKKQVAERGGDATALVKSWIDSDMIAELKT